MDDALLQAALALFNERMERLSRMYFKRMGEHIRHVGVLLPSDTNRLIEMRRMNLNLGAVQRAIERELRDDQELTAQVFLKAAQADSDFARALFGAEPASIQRNPALMRLLRAQIRITGGALQNLSQTTVEASGYRALLDEAIQAVTAGLTDYQSAMRAALRAAGTRGLRVTYPSGAVRRLDSAVRQNLLDGARQLSGAILEATGQEFGADGVEISAHPLCAPDHLPYQGRQFSRAEFEALQKALDRPFGQWNCRHVVFPILLGVSAPAHDERELEAYRMNSEETVELAGERKTRYQWTQRQRQIETAVRAQKDLAAAARAAGDDALRREAQRKILELEAEYERISQAAALEPRFERMRVDGFKDLAGRRLAGRRQGGRAGVLQTGGRSDILGRKVSGALTSKNDPSEKKRNAHAQRYYESIRNSNKAGIVQAISRNTGIDYKTVDKAITHVFYTKHALERGLDYFDSDYAIAESVRRLRTNDKIHKHDRILILHEAYESELMASGMSYEDAHKIAREKYNYDAALKEFWDDKNLW